MSRHARATQSLCLYDVKHFSHLFGHVPRPPPSSRSSRVRARSFGRLKQTHKTYLSVGRVLAPEATPWVDRSVQVVVTKWHTHTHTGRGEVGGASPKRLLNGGINYDVWKGTHLNCRSFFGLSLKAETKWERQISCRSVKSSASSRSRRWWKAYQLNNT